MINGILTREEACGMLDAYPAWATKPDPMPPPRTKQRGECPVCGFPGGKGFLQAYVPVGHPLFGKLVYCECWKAGLPVLLERASGLTGALKEYSLVTMIDDEGRAPAKAGAENFVNRPQGFFTVWGEFGAGKTYVLASIINDLRTRLVQGLYVRVPDLLDGLRSSYANATYDGLLRQMETVRVLALDELGQAKLTDWALEKLMQILDHRYVEAGRLGTVVSLHFDPGAPPDYLPERLGAILSRLRGTLGGGWPVVQMTGDLRGKEREAATNLI